MSNEQELLRRIRILEKRIFDKVPEVGKPFLDDLRFPASPGRINPVAAKPDFDYTNIGFLFDPADVEIIYIAAQMPHDWVAGSTIYPHVHWEPTTTNTGNVFWVMRYRWTNIGDTEAALFTDSGFLDAGDGTAYKHQLGDFAAIDGTGKTSSSILSILLFRNASDGSDSYTGDALLKEFDIHYLKDPAKSYYVE